MAATQQVATKCSPDFGEGSRELRDLLSGKGAGIAEMTRVLGPERVPAGFTITRAACVHLREMASSVSATRNEILMPVRVAINGVERDPGIPRLREIVALLQVGFDPRAEEGK